MALGADTGATQPFFASGAGEITLILIGALASGLFAWWLQYRRDVKEQNQTLILLKNAISPEGRTGLVERMERVESNLSVCSAELEAHEELTAAQRRELLESIAELRRWCEQQLRNLAA